MTLYEVAKIADSENRVIDAANGYEKVLFSDPSNVEALVNLMVLYWQSTDYGFSLALSLPKWFIEKAGKRLEDILGAGLGEFKSDPKVVFWKSYIGWIEFGGSFSIEKCRVLLKSHPEYREPGMYIYSVTAGKEGQDIVKEILQEYRSENTTRSKYVVSVIEGVAKRRRFKEICKNI